MANIKVMDSHLANMIAAGEVIERPSSVIKELVENSIDAGAKHIEVRVYEAGRKKIVVKDDGCGMDKEDAELAFKRHASSKLKSEHQLFKIKTMGFRGEALPSIASVSKVTMTTSTGIGAGTKVTIENEQMSVEDYTSRKGTIFTIEELFYNTPVRLKFLKTDVTENANSLEVMQRLAMSRCDIAFDFYIDERHVFSTSGRGDLLEVISRIYNNETAKKMIKVSYDELDFTIEGYIGKPELAKSNRYYMITILNERNVYIPKVQRAIIDAYSDFIFNSKYPFVVLKIRVEHSLVDVNVHPSKREIRLSNEDRICDAVNVMIKDTLLDKKPLAEVPSYTKEETPKAVVSPKIEEKISLLLDDELEVSDVVISRPSIDLRKEVKPVQVELPSMDEEVIQIKEEPIIEEKKVSVKAPLLIPIGQIHSTYIVCQGEDGMFLIDQHAANERINYEKFDKELNANITVVEPLIPYMINLSSSDVMKLTEDRLNMLSKIGLEVELFGSNTLKVRKMPLFIKELDEGTYIEELINQVLLKDKVDVSSLRKHVISTMACKASIKAHDKLSIIEMNDLIKTLFECDNPTCCPHGRPTIIHFSKYDIEKMFKRSGI